MDKLNIENEIQTKDAFVYIKGNLKIVFINEEVSDEDKLTLLLHEIGHIYDSQILDSEIVYNNIQREDYANEFSHYLKHPSIAVKALSFILKKPALIAIALAIVLTTSFGALNYSYKNKEIPTFSNNQLSNELYYVTQTGEKYHKKFCKHIKYKTNITGYTLEDVLYKGYEPCLDCIGEEEQ